MVPPGGAISSFAPVNFYPAQPQHHPSMYQAPVDNSQRTPASTLDHQKNEANLGSILTSIEETQEVRAVTFKSKNALGGGKLGGRMKLKVVSQQDETNSSRQHNNFESRGGEGATSSFTESV